MALPKSFLPNIRQSSRQIHITHIRPRPNTTLNPSRPSSTLHGAGQTGAGTGGPGGNGGVKKRSPHLVWYREIVPAMVPILLLSSTIFLSLTLLRTHLSHSHSLAESSTRIAELENQLESLRKRQARQREKDRKERERILPMVVERVLQKVGAMSEEEGDDEEEQHLLV